MAEEFNKYTWEYITIYGTYRINFQGQEISRIRDREEAETFCSQMNLAYARGFADGAEWKK